MAEHQHQKTGHRKIIVRECKAIHTGRRRDGEPYSMYQLIATKPDGTPIEQNLRSFEEMPVHEVLDVEITPFTSEQYGTSYTIKRKGLSRQQQEIESLKKRVEEIEAKLGITPGGSSGPAPPPMPPTPTPGVAPPPPPVPAATGGGDDIPF